MGGTWEEPCADGKRCGRGVCPKCSPTHIMPKDKRGSKKARDKAPSNKYIVCLAGTGTTKRAPGTDEYFTPDAAIAAAKKLRQSSVVVRGDTVIADVGSNGIVAFRT